MPTQLVIQTKSEKLKFAMMSMKSNIQVPMFPMGDTLGVVFSYLQTIDLIRHCFVVNHEWKNVLETLPHAWGYTLYFTFITRAFSAKYFPSYVRFAWNHVKRLEYNAFWSAEMFENIVKYTRNLMELDFHANKNINEHSLRQLRSPLVYLDLSMTRVDDALLKTLKGLPLRYLDLTGCTAITDDGIRFALSEFRLEYFRFSRCPKITYRALSMMQHYPLKYFESYEHLSGFQDVSETIEYGVFQVISMSETFLCKLLQKPAIRAILICGIYRSDFYHADGIGHAIHLYECIQRHSEAFDVCHSTFHHIGECIFVTRKNCQCVDLTACAMKDLWSQK